jgi:hypothetical protein
MQMRLVGRTLILLAVGSLVGCGQSGGLQPLKPAAFARQVSDGTVVVEWSCTQPRADLLRVEGAVGNPAVPGPIRDVELTLYGVGRSGRDVSRVAGGTASYQIPPMAASPFRLDLPLAGSEVRVDLRYQYHGALGGGSADDGGAAVIPSNLVRDVCRLL